MQRHEGMIVVKRQNPEEYQNYDNYDAINVDKTADIPCDYAGVMGVPITFLAVYNPEQFEILGILIEIIHMDLRQKFIRKKMGRIMVTAIVVEP